MHTLIFRDEKSFYRKLTTLTRKGESVLVQTNFRSVEEIPDRLLKLLNLNEQQMLVLSHKNTGYLIPGAMCLTALNRSALYVLAGTATGAAVGVVGGPAGMAIGATIGLLAGVTAAALAEDKQVKVRIGRDQTLEFEVAGHT